MNKEIKEGLKFWGTIGISAGVPGSIAAILGAPWWGIVLSAMFIPFLIIGFMIFMARTMTSIF